MFGDHESKQWCKRRSSTRSYSVRLLCEFPATLVASSTKSGLPLYFGQNSYSWLFSFVSSTLHDHNKIRSSKIDGEYL